LDFSQFFTEKGIEFSLNPLTSRISAIKAGGVAAVAVMPKNESELIYAVKALVSEGIPYKIIGGCTNTFFDDRGFSGALIFTDKLTVMRNLGAGRIYLSAGTKLSGTIPILAKSGISLAEELYGIPGSVGGAVRNNAGAFGKCVCDVFCEGRFYSPKADKILKLSKSEMGFSYRNSLLQQEELILLSAVFSIGASDSEKISERMSGFLAKRREMQPSLPSLGSFYKRLGDIIPARLIDDAGLRGYSHGGASVSEKHAGFIVNNGSATANDIIAVAEHIESLIKTKYGVLLVREAEFVCSEV